MATQYSSNLFHSATTNSDWYHRAQIQLEYQTPRWFIQYTPDITWLNRYYHYNNSIHPLDFGITLTETEKFHSLLSAQVELFRYFYMDTLSTDYNQLSMDWTTNYTINDQHKLKTNCRFEQNIYPNFKTLDYRQALLSGTWTSNIDRWQLNAALNFGYRHYTSPATVPLLSNGQGQGQGGGFDHNRYLQSKAKDPQYIQLQFNTARALHPRLGIAFNSLFNFLLNPWIQWPDNEITLFDRQFWYDSFSSNQTVWGTALSWQAGLQHRVQLSLYRHHLKFEGFQYAIISDRPLKSLQTRQDHQWEISLNWLARFIAFTREWNTFCSIRYLDNQSNITWYRFQSWDVSFTLRYIP